MKIEEDRVFTISLNESEARWLKNIMQNPFYGQSREEEDKNDKHMRSLFWEMLYKVKP